MHRYRALQSCQLLLFIVLCHGFWHTSIRVEKILFVSRQFSSGHHFNNHEEVDVSHSISKSLHQLLFNQLKYSIKIMECKYGEVYLHRLPTMEEYAASVHHHDHDQSHHNSHALQLICRYNVEFIDESDSESDFDRDYSDVDSYDETLSIPLAVQDRQYGLLKIVKAWPISGLSNRSDYQAKELFMLEHLEYCREIMSRALDMELYNAQQYTAERQQLQLQMQKGSAIQAEVTNYLQSLRTLTRLAKKRIKDDDYLGKEILDNVIVQADAIADSVALLSPDSSNRRMWDSENDESSKFKQENVIESSSTSLVERQRELGEAITITEGGQVSERVDEFTTTLDTESQMIRNGQTIMDVDEFWNVTKDETEIIFSSTSKKTTSTKKTTKKK